MKNLLHIIVILFQLSITWVGALGLYMIMAFFNLDYGLDEMIGFVVFQPILGVIVASISVMVCLMVGLPIRLVKNLNQWWINHFYISYVGVLVACVLFFVAYLPGFRETVLLEEADGAWQRTKEVPNISIALTAWFLFIFMTLHSYPPPVFIEKAEVFLHFIIYKIKGLLRV